MNEIVGFIILFLIAVTGVIIYSSFNPEPGNLYLKGIKDGYAEHCNFSHTPLKHGDVDAHYESGWSYGLEEAITNDCDLEYYKKL